MKEGEELEHPWLNRSIESAQKKVEQQNYSIRKRLLQYDDVLNQQREVVYGIRNGAIHSERPKVIIFEQVEEEVFARLEAAGIGEKSGASSAAIESAVGWLNTHFPISLRVEDMAGNNIDALAAKVLQRIRDAYAVKESVEIPEALGGLERYVVINGIDRHWQEHLTEMEELRRSIGLRSYGQKDPLVEYKGEAYKFFEELMINVRGQICTGLFRSASNLQAFENMLAQLSRTARTQGPESGGGGAGAVSAAAGPQVRTTITTRGSAAAQGNLGAGGGGGGGKELTLPMPKPVPVARQFPKVGRNDPCPCGSGKKFKACHGA